MGRRKLHPYIQAGFIVPGHRERTTQNVSDDKWRLQRANAIWSAMASINPGTPHLHMSSCGHFA
jgi:hypothetical protein